MAYLRRGESDQDFDEYDRTPFSGGYDQAAIYGRPKPPSEETCYPISRTAESGSGTAGSYGAEFTPYLPAGGDEARPTYGGGVQSESGFGASYGGFESGYGRPKPASRPSWESSYGSQDTYEGGNVGFGKFKTDYGEGVGLEQPQGGGFGYKPSYGGGFNEQSPQEWSSGYHRPPEVPPPEKEGYGGYGRPSGYRVEGEDGGGYFGEEPSQDWSSGYQRPPEIPPPEEEAYGGYGRPGYDKADESVGFEGYQGHHHHRPHLHHHHH
eukprot:c18819_g1_i1 orf=615-1412(-)